MNAEIAEVMAEEINRHRLDEFKRHWRQDPDWLELCHLERQRIQANNRRNITPERRAKYQHNAKVKASIKRRNQAIARGLRLTDEERAERAEKRRQYKAEWMRAKRAAA